jgi:hypothetical protein
MKKICLALILFISLGACAQLPNYFRSVDSLKRYNNKYIRNSAIDAFSNLRLNTFNNGVVQYLDSLRNLIKDTLYAYRVPGKDSVYFKVGVAGSPIFMYRDSIGTGGGGGGGTNNANIGSQFRWLNTATQELRTAAGVWINIDSTTTSNALTFKPDTSSGKLSTQNFVTNIKNYPNEKRLGTIYYRASWDSANIREFVTTGTATVTLNGNKPVFAAGAIDYNNWVLLRSIPTGLNYWKVTASFKVATSGGTWFGPGLKSLVTHDGANFGVMTFTAMGTGTNQFIYDETGTTQYATSTAPSRSIGDILVYTLERRDSTIIGTLTNQTTSSATTTQTYSYPSNQSVPVPNVGTWGFMVSGTSGTVELQSLRVESDEWQYPTLLLIGNSKTAVGYADSWAGRAAEKINATYPHAAFTAGSAENMTDIYFKINEIKRLNPQQVICVDCWSNSTRAGVSTAVVVDSLQKMWETFTNGGTPFKFLPLPEDSTVNGANGLTAVKNWIVTNHAADYIDAWTTLGGGTNKLLLTYAHSGADKVHLNQAGQDVVLSAITSSAQITTTATNRRSPYRVFSPELAAEGDSLHFMYPIIPRANTIVRFTSSYKLAPSSIYDNGKYVVVTPDGTSALPSTSGFVAGFKGAVAFYGNVGQINLYDRTNATNSFYKYSDANIMRFGFNTGGGSPAELTTMDLAGKWRISPVTTGTYRSSFTISQNYNFNYAPNREGFGFNSAYASHGYLSATALGDISTNSFFSHTFYANGATTYPHNATVWIEGPPKDSTNVTTTTPLALEVAAGTSWFGGNVLTQKHFTSLQSYTSVVAGAGAGTSPTLTVTGGDVSGTITLTSGTTPASGGTILTLTFLNAYGASPPVVLTPGNSAAAALSGAANPYVTTSTTAFIFTAGATALAASTSYVWYYHVLN